MINQADRMNRLKADRSQKLSAGSHDHSEGGGERTQDSLECSRVKGHVQRDGK